MKYYRFKSIKTRLTFWFLLLTLLPLTIVLIITSYQMAKSIEYETTDRLYTISQLKVQQVNTWLDEIRADMNTLSVDIDIINIDEVFSNNSNSSQTLENINKHLNSYVSNYYSYYEFFIINSRTGVISTSTKHGSIGKDVSNNEYFTAPMKSGSYEFKDIYYSNSLMDYCMTFSIPIYGKDKASNDIVAILVARIDLNNSIYRILLNRTGLGKSGEALLVNKDVVTLNQLRWYDNAPLNLQIDAEPAKRAAAGETGIIKANDYRGQEVLAAYTFIPRTKWGVIVKQDTQELNEPVYMMIMSFVLIFIIVSILISAASIAIAGSIAKVIVGMNDVARSMRSGNYKVRNEIDTNDELGSLAAEFNNMADMTESRIVVQQGISGISKVMIGRESMDDFSIALLRELQSLSNANICVFYILNENQGIYEPLQSIGASMKALVNYDAKNPEGDFGNAITSKSIYYLKNINKETPFTYKTIIGNVVPNELITIPLLVENSVVAFITLAGINRFSVDFHDIINRSWDIINTSYSNFISSERTRVFADHLSRINDQLENKTKELEEQTAEVKKQAEKIHESSRVLQLQNIELDEQRREVVEANKLKSEFLSNMSHELRTPLNSIMALSSVLITDSKEKLSSDELDYLNIIERNGKRLLTLINDILDLSKIEAGKMDIMPGYFSLSSLVSMVIENIQSLAHQKNIIIKTEIAEDLAEIESDEMRLHQVLLNIISNAVKFTDDGEISVVASEIKNHIIIKISDTGIGIDNEVLPYIFDEFRQADGTSSRRFEGTGLGLAIANKIIQILGGTIKVESTKNIGTTFTVSIPIVWSGPKNKKTFVKQGGQQNNNNTDKTILIIDDEQKVIDRISTQLSTAGYNTHGVTNGRDALEYARKNSPFAITLDVLMPDMDGWELLQKLKSDQQTKDIPVVIVSVSDEKDTGIALGAIGHVTKPVDRNELLQEIKKANKITETVMIVDDNETDLKIMADILEENRITTIRINNGRECLNIISKILPSVLVLDLLMPEIDGFEVLVNIRNNPITKDIPVIVVTAKELSEEEKQLLNDNVISIINKSETISEDLFNEVESIIGTISNPIVSNSQNGEIVLDSNASFVSGNNLHNLLIVEDNPDNMTTIKAILKGSYNFFEAIDGEEAIKTIDIVLPDLILLDMSLPKLSGKQLIDIFKSDIRTRNIPVIAVTADAMIGDRELILKAGCDEYVSKPIDKNDLIEKIKQLLGH